MKQILIGKNKNFIFYLNLAFGSAILLASSFGVSFAATGDILYQNCASNGSCTGAGSKTGWVRTVETNGCRSGSCLKLVGTSNPFTNGNVRYGAGSTPIGTTSVAGKNEITISSWVKLNKNGYALKDGNLKGTRLYVGSNTLYWASEITPHHGKDYYMDRVYGTVRPAPWFKLVTTKDNSAYCRDNGDGTYTSTGYIKGAVKSGGPTRLGATWVHLTKWVKLPSTATSADGAVRVWLGNELMLDISNARHSPKHPNSKNYFTKLTWYPSSEAGEPFEHWVDDMIIYEGYVPPKDGGYASAPPPSTNILPSTPVDFKTGS